MNQRALFLAGATATGKSEIAMALAERFNGEIISVDSMQVYRGLDIGTAKPDASARARVPHHLVDVTELDAAFDAAQFVRLAQIAVTEICSRGRVPIFCGGTGLYFRAFLEGLGEAPASNAALRAELNATALIVLLEELERRDPVTFATIDRQNPRRVIRALEVIRLTGKPFSAQRADWPATASKNDSQPNLLWMLVREPADLHERINARVDGMFKRGLVAEVDGLLKQGLAKNQTAMQAIGYRQVAEHLRGERKLDETIELVKIRTRQFAKRQMTWFRRQGEWQRIMLGRQETAENVAAKIKDSLKFEKND